MSIKQLTVFVENKKGKLREVADVLAEAGVDLRAMSIADTSEFGILRLIVNNISKAREVLRDNGFVVSETEVLGIQISDRPGGLAEVLALLDEHDIDMEYLYAFIAKVDGEAYLVIRVDDIESVKKVLEENNMPMLTQQDVEAM